MKRKLFLPLMAMGSFLTLVSNNTDVLANTGYGGGAGTESNPYLISTPEHLNQLQLDVNINGVDTSGKYYRLTQNIDLSGYDNDLNAANGNFTPIGGQSGNSFKGTFDGNGKVISNLIIFLSDSRPVGLFGQTNSALIQNFGIENVQIEGQYRAAALIGSQFGGTVSQCYSTGVVEGSGGLVGYQYGGAVIDKSYSTATVVGSYVGGLVGEQADGRVSESYAVGRIESSSSKGGGLVAKISGVPEPFTEQLVENSYWDKETTGQSSSNYGGLGLNTSQMTGESAKTNMAGFDFNNVWKTTNSYPKLKWEKSQSASVSETSDVTVNGTVQTMVADVVIPSVSPDLVINPNLEEGYVAPEFSVSNDSVSPIKLELKTFEQTTNTFNDVLPTKYDSWVGLNKQQSEDIALGLVAKEGDGWQSLTTPTSYVANHINREVGIIKPNSSVDFSFDVKHGTSFSEAKTVQYKMVFVFDLMN